jgi:hypothetical protein
MSFISTALVVGVATCAFEVSGNSATNRQGGVEIALNDEQFAKPYVGSGLQQAEESNPTIATPRELASTSGTSAANAQKVSQIPTSDPVITSGSLFGPGKQSLALEPGKSRGTSLQRWPTSSRRSGGSKLSFGLWSQTSSQYRPVEVGDVEIPKTRVPKAIELSR